jgi:hypothetical protein
VLVSIGIPGSGKKEIEQRIELMAQSNKRLPNLLLIGF